MESKTTVTPGRLGPPPVEKSLEERVNELEKRLSTCERVLATGLDKLEKHNHDTLGRPCVPLLI